MIPDGQPSFPVHTVSADLAIGLLVNDQELDHHGHTEFNMGHISPIEMQEQATGQNLWYQESLAFGGESAT